jgi:hypothetical protein
MRAEFRDAVQDHVRMGVASTPEEVVVVFQTLRRAVLDDIEAEKPGEEGARLLSFWTNSSNRDCLEGN